MPAGLDPLLESLTRAQRKGFEYKGFVANHAPMGAEVLAAMGVGEDLVRWTDTYLTWVDEPEAAQWRIDGSPGSVAEALGKIERSTDWVDFFTRELEGAHWRDVVDRWWFRLLPGISAAGTHGFLRTAHAVRAMNEHGSEHPLLLNEIAHGLGYWAARYQELPGGYASARPLRSPAGALETIPRLPATVKSRREGIPGRFELLDGNRQFADGVESFRPQGPWQDQIGRLTGIGARAFAAHRNTPIPFVHLVTAPSALRMLSKDLTPEAVEATAWHLWQFFAGVFAGFGALTPEPAPLPEAPPPSIDALRTAAVEHGDEHVIKFTDACLTEFTASGDDIFLRAASLAPARFGALSCKPL
ncbi:hypothetical protein ACWEGE_42890 [Amycolatopsis sp. NPDC004747]